MAKFRYGCLYTVRQCLRGVCDFVPDPYIDIVRLRVDEFAYEIARMDIKEYVRKINKCVFRAVISRRRPPYL